MFLANLLVLMVLLLPQALLGHQLHPDLTQSIQTLLLTRLGLRSLPTPREDAPVPQYLLDLYRFHLQEFHLVEDPEFSFPRQHVQKANTVRGFHHLETLDATPDASDTVRIVFNVSSIPEDEQITSAELRLLPEGTDRVSVFLSGGHAQTHMVSTLLESRLLNGSSVGSWQSFSLSPALFQQAASDSGRVEFVVEAQGETERARTRRSVGLSEPRWVRERPLLVTYSHDGHASTLAPRAQRRRRHRQSWRVKRNGGRAAKLRRLSQARCRRHPLYVDFNDVGWNKWIVAPSGYHAYFCLGECRFPLPDHMNSTSHAMVQTLVNSVNGAVPRPCCVPTALSPIAMLYLDQQDRVVLKNYEDMVVEGCGCR